MVSCKWRRRGPVPALVALSVHTPGLTSDKTERTSSLTGRGSIRVGALHRNLLRGCCTMRAAHPDARPAHRAGLRTTEQHMRGVVFTGNRQLEIRSFPDPRPGPGEAVVQIRASGLCGSDMHTYRGATAVTTISGHEPCGVIAELGAGAPSGLQVGDRVMVHHYAGCGVCETCALGFEQACKQGRVTYGGGTGHGANADAMLVPTRTLVLLPEELSFEAGAAIACGTGTAWCGLKKLQVSGGDTVAIFGQGPVGLSGTVSAKAMGARVIAIDIIPERLALAQELGADWVVDSRDVDPVAVIRDLTGGRGVPAALETSGNSTARVQTLEVLQQFGRCCYVGLGGPATVDFNRDIVLKVATIHGSWTFSKAELIAIARFMVETKVPLHKLVTHRFTLDQAEEAFRTFDRGATGKCVILPHAGVSASAY